MEVRMLNTSWFTDLFRSIDMKDTQAFAKFLSEDVMYRYGNTPAVRGLKATLYNVQALFESVRSIHHEVSQSWVHEESAICHGMVTYIRLDGSMLIVPFANIFYLIGDRITRYLVFVDVSGLPVGDG
jgi:SnoaL-like domain